MTTPSRDLHVGIDRIYDKELIIYLIKELPGVGEVFVEGDDFDTWGEEAEEGKPWHVVIRTDHPEYADALIEILQPLLRPGYGGSEGGYLAVLTDTEDWSVDIQTWLPEA